jgi:hypothetical protein
MPSVAHWHAFLSEWLLAYDRRIAKRYAWPRRGKTFDLLNFFGPAQSFFSRARIFICGIESFLWARLNLIWGHWPGRPGLDALCAN